MFLRKFSLIVAFLLVLCLLCSCAESNPPELPDPTISTPAEDSTTPSTEPSKIPTEDTTAATHDPETQAVLDRLWLDAEDIYVYPFTDEELAEAAALVLQDMLDFNPEEVEELEVHSVAFNPYMTDVIVRKHYYAEYYSGGYIYGDLSLEDLYRSRMIFSVVYSCVYTDEMVRSGPVDEKTEDHTHIFMCLSRENPDSPWQNPELGFAGKNHFPLELPSREALLPEDLAQFSLPGCRPLGGYRMKDGSYWLYVWDETAGSSRLVKLDYAAPADLSTAEPRD